MKSKVFLCFLVMLCLSSNAHGQGISVSPSQMFFYIVDGKASNAQLVIYNTNDVGINFSVNAQSHPDHFNIVPSFGMLEPGSSARVVISAKEITQGNYSDYFAVSGSPSSSDGIFVEVGVLVRASIVSFSTAKTDLFIGLLVSGLIVISGFGSYLRLAKGFFRG